MVWHIFTQNQINFYNKSTEAISWMEQAPIRQKVVKISQFAFMKQHNFIWTICKAFLDVFAKTQWHWPQDFSKNSTKNFQKTEITRQRMFPRFSVKFKSIEEFFQYQSARLSRISLVEDKNLKHHWNRYCNKEK